MTPDQKVDTNATTRTIFEENAAKRYAGVLVYKLRRKWSLESNADNMSTKNISSYQLFVIWKSDNKYECSVSVLLTEHDSTITWNEDKLKELDYQSFNLLRNGRTIKNTWVLDNTVVLMTASKWKEDNRTVEIAISEDTRKADSRKSLSISSNM
jgi:hypothetical protein